MNKNMINDVVKNKSRRRAAPAKCTSSSSHRKLLYPEYIYIYILELDCLSLSLYIYIYIYRYCLSYSTHICQEGRAREVHIELIKQMNIWQIIVLVIIIITNTYKYKYNKRCCFLKKVAAGPRPRSAHRAPKKNN